MYIKNFRISPIGDTLEIWIKIPNNDYFENITIERIAIQDWKHYSEVYPDEPQLELIPDNVIDEYKIDLNAKEVIKSFPLKDLQQIGLSTDGPIYMYIKTVGIPNTINQQDGPTECFKDITVYMTINWFTFYNRAIKLFNTMNDCNPNNRQELIDIYLKKQLFADAVVYKEFNLANHFWDSIMSQEYKKANCYNGCYKPLSQTVNYNTNTCKPCN